MEGLDQQQDGGRNNNNRQLWGTQIPLQQWPQVWGINQCARPRFVVNQTESLMESNGCSSSRQKMAIPFGILLRARCMNMVLLVWS